MGSVARRPSLVPRIWDCNRLDGGRDARSDRFLFYCLLRWGRWNLYMATQEAGWAILPDYLAVFKPANYRWLIPPLNDPRNGAKWP